MTSFISSSVLDIARKQIDIIDRNLLGYISHYAFLSNLWKIDHLQPCSVLSQLSHPVYDSILKLCATSLCQDSPLPKEDIDLLIQEKRLEQQLYRTTDLLITTLEERFCIVKLIGDYKNRHNLPIYVVSRWQEVIETIKEQAKNYRLDGEKIEAIYTLIHKHALNIEEN